MLELYHGDHSVCAQKVRIALAEKDLAWTSHLLDLQAGDQHRPDYLRLNPNAVVPTIVHDGTVVIESTVINEYLDDAFSDHPLRPAGGAERAKMRLWTKRLDEGIHHATTVVSFAITFRHIQLRKKTIEQIEAELERVPNRERRERQRDTVRNGVKSAYFAEAIRQFDQLFGDMDAALGDTEWLAGGSFSLADIGYIPYLTRFRHLHLLGMLDKRPRLSAWLERVEARRSYDAAIKRWENAEKLALLNRTGAEAWPQVEAVIAS